MEFKERINKYDNMKGIGIFLVVLVHLDILNMINHTANNIIQLIICHYYSLLQVIFQK